MPAKKSKKQQAAELLEQRIEAAKLLVAGRPQIEKGVRVSWVIAFKDSIDLLYFEGTERQAEAFRATNSSQRKTKGYKRFALELEIELKRAIRGVKVLESKFTYTKQPPKWWEVIPGVTEEDLKKSNMAADLILQKNERIRRGALRTKAAELAQVKKDQEARYRLDAEKRKSVRGGAGILSKKKDINDSLSKRPKN